MRIGLAIFDSQRRLLFANPRFVALLALLPDRVVRGFGLDAMLSLMRTREEFAGPDGSPFIPSLRDAAPGVVWTGRRQCGGEISIELKLPEDMPRLCGGERRIAPVRSQLLANAVNSTEAGGSVTVEAGLMPGQDLFVSVADTGIGITEGEPERVFEPFTQVDGSLAHRYPGAGLGLFTAHAVVTAHGGQSHLTSRPEEGTTARIVLPGSRSLFDAGLNGRGPE